VPFARDLHPEFGYLGSAPRVFRRLGLALSFVAFGIAAGASGIAVFMASPDSDPVTSANPLGAMALAPSGALIDPQPAQPVTQSQKKPAIEPSGQKADEEGAKATPKEGSIKPTCRESLGELSDGDCIPVRVVRVRPLRAANDRPLIAAVPIGHRDEPTVVPASPTTAVAVGPSPAVQPEDPKATPAPTETAAAEATPADAAPAAEPTPPAPTPPVTSKKPQPRVHHAKDESRRRNHHSYASSYGGRSPEFRERSWSYSARSSPSAYFQGGYARVW
jgi:hypothetical protein